jgi:hypothetical protein
MRIVAAWLLALALPVQGIAATTMFACGPGHDASAGHAPSALHHGAIEHESHDHAGHAADGHPMDPVHASGEDASGDAGTCSACASCCLGAAIPQARIDADVAVASSTQASDLGFAAVAFLTNGPERPPRPFLA